MAKEKLFQIGVKALITNKDGRILLLDSGSWHLKDQKRHWDIPGGRIQEGHSIMGTLKRELEEEIGVDEVKEVKLFTAVISNFSNLFLLIYKIKIPEGSKIILSEEHSGYKWVDNKEASKKLSYKYPSEFIELLNPF